MSGDFSHDRQPVDERDDDRHPSGEQQDVRRPSSVGRDDELIRPTRRHVVAVMPAYNAAATLERTVADLDRSVVADIVLVDDGSTDETVRIARRLGLETIVHERNTGYGGNQKTCYARALELGATHVVMIHPDYQYDARVTPQAVALIEWGICDVILGSRIRSRREALEGGMPAWKYIANRGLTTVENVTLGQNLGDFHSGFRAYSRDVLETVPWRTFSDDFVFDSQFLASAVACGFKLGDIPVPVRYFDEASSISFRRSVRYGLATLGVLAEYGANRLGLRRSERMTPRRLSDERDDVASSSPNVETNRG